MASGSPAYRGSGVHAPEDLGAAQRTTAEAPRLLSTPELLAVRDELLARADALRHEEDSRQLGALAEHERTAAERRLAEAQAASSVREGADRNRTGLSGFAGRRVTTPPRRRGALLSVAGGGAGAHGAGGGARAGRATRGYNRPTVRM